MANVVHNTLTDADLHASERQYAGNPNGALTGIQGQYCEDTATGDVYRSNGGTSWEKIIDFSEVGKVPLTASDIGSTVQAYDADLTAIAGLTPTDSNIIVGNGTTWVAESGATARTSLGLGTGDSPTFAGLTVDTDTLYVDSANDRVGIGTTSPAETLDVDGILRVGGDLGATKSGFFISTGGSNGVNAIRISPDEQDFTHASGYEYGAQINAYSKNKVSSNGNIGIYGINSLTDLYATTNASSTLQGIGAGIQIRRNEATDISTNGNLFGVNGTVTHGSSLNSSAVSDNVRSVRGQITNQAGTITNSYGFDSSFNVATLSSTTATSTTIYGLRTSATVGRSAGNSTGTVTSYYDAYLQGATVYSPSTVSSKWGVYQLASDHTNFFAGDVGIGVTNPSAKLDVSGGVTTDGDVKNKDFSSGFSGSKWQITEAGSAEFDSLTVRGSLKAYELIVKQISTIGGTEILSVAQGKVDSKTAGSPDTITVQSVSGTPAQPFKVGDIIIIQASNMETAGEDDGSGFTVRRVVFSVTGVTAGSNVIQVGSFTSGSISDVQVGDVMVAIGSSSNTARQSLMYRNVDRENDRLIMRVQDDVDAIGDLTATANTRVAFGDIGDYTGGAYAETFGFFAGDNSNEHVLITSSGMFFKDGGTTLAQLSSNKFFIGASSTSGNRLVYDGSNFTLVADTFNLSAGELVINSALAKKIKISDGGEEIIAIGDFDFGTKNEDINTESATTSSTSNPYTNSTTINTGTEMNTQFGQMTATRTVDQNITTLTRRYNVAGKWVRIEFDWQASGYDDNLTGEYALGYTITYPSGTNTLSKIEELSRNELDTLDSGSVDTGYFFMPSGAGDSLRTITVQSLGTTGSVNTAQVGRIRIFNLSVKTIDNTYTYTDVGNDGFRVYKNGGRNKIEFDSTQSSATFDNVGIGSYEIKLTANGDLGLYFKGVFVKNLN